MREKKPKFSRIKRTAAKIKKRLMRGSANAENEKDSQNTVDMPSSPEIFNVPRVVSYVPTRKTPNVTRTTHRHMPAQISSEPVAGPSSRRSPSPEFCNIPRVSYNQTNRAPFNISQYISSSDSSELSSDENTIIYTPPNNSDSDDETVIYDPPRVINWNFLIDSLRGRSNLPDVSYDMSSANANFPRSWINKALKFDRTMQQIDWIACVNCRRAFPNLEIDARRNCYACSKSAVKFTAANMMDPGPQPEILKKLTLIESMLIAKVHPVVRLYRICGQQLGYSGHVINFRQDVRNLYRKLPVNPSSLEGLILVNRETSAGTAAFRVRSQVVREALFWLKSNHIYYSDIEIDEEQLSQLPEDGSVLHLIPTLNSVSDNQINQNIDRDANDYEENESNYPHIPQLNQEQAIRSNLRRDNIVWPDISSSPINEFTTEGYITQAFPALFPYGRADFRQPRDCKVSYIEYFKFLMQYEDGRFAKDSRFRFFAFNSIMRWQAINQGNLYVKRNAFANLDAEAILERISTNPHLADSIMFHAGKLRASRSYWFQRSGELHDMVEQLSTPHVFFTLSAADYHWPDLFRVLDPNNEIDTSLEGARRKLMHDNPLITAWFFQKRVKAFLTGVVKQCFEVEDFWYRFEWQWRGSPHVHGVLWLKSGPKFENLDQINEQQLANITRFCGRLARAWNPNKNQPMSSVHPCRKKFSDILDDPTDLTTLLNRLQRHTSCGAHCLRKKRGTNVEKCRFGFPHPLNENERVHKDDNWKFEPRRNDEYMAKYNPFISQTWRGNTDISPILSKRAILLYIVKYATKAENESKDYREILQLLAENVNPDTPAATLIRKMLVGSTAERDFSAQEVCHLLMGWPLFHASRSFVTVVIRDENWQRLTSAETSDSAIFERYKNRGQEYDNISLFIFAKEYRYACSRIIERAVPAIVRVYPKVKLTDDPIENEKYFKIQCILHIPWRDSINSLIADFRFSVFPWSDAFDHMQKDIQQHSQLSLDNLESSFEDDPTLDHFHEHIYPDMALSRTGNVDDSRDPIGKRLIDIAHDWESNSVSVDEKLVLMNWLSNQKQNYITPTVHRSSSTFNLSEDQQRVMNTARQQISELRSGRMVTLKRIMVQGKAGSGKSYLISAITEEFRRCFGADSVELLAPTGAAAININGMTIHSFLRIAPNHFSELRSERLRNFQLRMSKVKVIIIDEMSMIGLRLLNKISIRLQEAKGECSEPFGGFIVYFFGDMQQLPPVRNTAFYCNSSDPQVNQGKILLESIQMHIELVTNHRQSGFEQRQFREILDALAVGEVTSDQFELLNARRKGVLSQDEIMSFRNALRLLPTNEMADSYNENVLRKSGLPIAFIPSDNSSKKIAKLSFSKAQCLEKVLTLSVGTRVMLRCNLWTEVGLVNGSLGTVKEIIYETDTRPPQMPAALLISFDNYSGPHYQENAVPITPVIRHWKSEKGSHWRKQFPLTVAYAVTIHKAQGLTLDKAVINIGEQERSLGISYVAMSRVKSLDSLMIDQILTKERFDRIRKKSELKSRKDFLRRHFN